jgi:hypothetical protein
MDRETREALELSIEKWERIYDGVGEDHGSADCPLCEKFLKADIDNLCKGCPVSLKTKRIGCRETPYDLWNFARQEYNTRAAINPVLKAIAKEMLEFLRGLRPPEPEFDLRDVIRKPFKYIKPEGFNRVKIDDKFAEFFDIPTYLWPNTSLGTLAALISYMEKKAREMGGII